MVRAGCVFVAGIHPSRTWTSGSFESVRWNACMHRLDLGLYSHPKEFWGEWSLNPCLLQGKNPLYRKCPQRRIEPATPWTASPSTTNWAIPAPFWSLKVSPPTPGDEELRFTVPLTEKKFFHEFYPNIANSGEELRFTVPLTEKKFFREFYPNIANSGEELRFTVPLTEKKFFHEFYPNIANSGEELRFTVPLTEKKFLHEFYPNIANCG